MKLRLSFLLAVVLLTVSCQRARLSPVVLQSPAEDKTTKPLAKASSTGAATASSSKASKSKNTSKSSGSVAGMKPAASSEKPKTASGEHSAPKVESKEDRLAEAARLAAKKKRLAAARRAQAKKLASASLEAGRQLLREEQNTAALRAFREAVRLNSHSPEAWIGIAYVCERNGNTKDAVDAFREAKRLWGM